MKVKQLNPSFVAYSYSPGPHTAYAGVRQSAQRDSDAPSFRSQSVQQD